MINNFSSVVESLHPDLSQDAGHYMIQQDNEKDGPYIKEWNPPDGRPKPTQQQLETASTTFDNDAHYRAKKDGRILQDKKLKAVVMWIADKLNMTQDEAIEEIKEVIKTI